MTDSSGALRRAGRALLLLVLALPLGGLHQVEALFAPSAELWARWQAHDPGSTRTIDHGAWDRLLKAYLVVAPGQVNRFAYRRVTPADRAALDAYIAGLAALPVSRTRRDEQRAYWINLYNALTVTTVLARYPVASIRDIDSSPGLFADGPWDAHAVIIEGEAVTLNDIEHRILRPIWRDPRLHYALNCASIGCPDLLPTAFTADNTERLLEAAARGYVNHPRGAGIEGGALTVSSIYNWYAEDFGKTEEMILAHLRRYAAPPLAAALDEVSEIDGYAYDWALNDAPGGTAASHP